MRRLRHYLRTNDLLCMVLVLTAFIMKAVIPAGFMVDASAGQVTVLLCHGDNGDEASVVHIAFPQKTDQFGDGYHHGDVGSTCPCSALSMSALVDFMPTFLRMVLSVAVVLGLAGIAFEYRKAIRYILPPMRAPPFRFERL